MNRHNLMQVGTARGRTQSRGPGGVAGFAIVFAACVVVSLIAWIPLSAPTRILRSLFSRGGVLDLGGPVCTSSGYGCSFANVALIMLPAIIVSGVLFLIRRQLARWLLLLGPRLPAKARFLLAPVIATIAFVMTWGYVHSTTPYKFGLVPEIIFPALVGLFTFATAQHGASITQLAPRLFDARDKLPIWARLGAVIVIPTVVSIALMRHRPVPFIDFRQQLIVLISLTIGFAALATRRIALRAKDTGASEATSFSTAGGRK